MGKKVDLIGKRFGRLVVIEETPRRVGGCPVWKCLCDCGNYTEADSRNLTTKDTQSCGCLQKEWIKSFSKTARKEAYRHNKKENWKEETCLSMLTTKKFKNNKSGVKGVFWHTEKQIWCAKIGFQNRQIFLGYFSKLEDATKARKEAEEKYFTPILEKYGRLEESK